MNIEYGVDMKKEWSKHWVASKQRRKQRKYRYNAPLSTRHKFLSAHLSKELRERFKRRSFPIRKGDEVVVMRGEFKGVKGKVERVDMKRVKVYIDGLRVKKVNGSEVAKPLEPSNLMITELNLEDKERVKALERGK